MSLAPIRALVQSELVAIDHFICTELQSDIPFINQLVDYILKAGGKRIRPMLALLTARAFDHQHKQHIDIAAAIELFHTATLLHDDVVDSSTLRRGHETANAIWGNGASVLVGDFLYTRAFQVIVKLESFDILKIFTNASNILAEGEILQMLNCHDPDTTEAAYYEVIRRKTAKLFEVAAQSGTALVTQETQPMRAMGEYGLQLGMAYQLIDDAMDYSSTPDEMGKNIGNDLTEGKPTLPLIHALRTGTPAEAELIRTAIQTGSSENLNSIINIIESTGAIEYTANAAKRHAKQAQATLAHIPESPYRQALHDLTEFVVARNY